MYVSLFLIYVFLLLGSELILRLTSGLLNRNPIDLM